MGYKRIATGGVVYTLTDAQARMLADVRRDGVRVYNGRARRTVEALDAKGLVDVNYSVHAQAKGNGIQWVERLEVFPSDRHRRMNS